MQKNNYLVDYQLGSYKIEVVCPSYKAFNNDLGFYWDLGMSLSVGHYSAFDFHLGFIFGWMRVVKYANK